MDPFLEDIRKNPDDFMVLNVCASEHLPQGCATVANDLPYNLDVRTVIYDVGTVLTAQLCLVVSFPSGDF
eukprot:1155957-Pelagomonas_calceolata.AAC.5